ncbi:hypothetical protein DAPPUDRAFT_305494 [Daphnia pulex]|uniref:Sushi domain-containing protein n=1 Tax=Daphnia pulex TaxID=6669 RepID=E9FX31_DAPPU|nr:hypothetical protein DAPPUDRAFT_305494 [Daphnia pulex]|eukprot:EFX88000.1 hypothetical protein DAPPUDRAFT_305494 [Daphnia pulex]
MVTTKVLYFSLTASVAIALAAIIFIIVDKTTYCRDGTPKPNTAVSYEDRTVVCLPGYVFSDGQSTHYITCDSPPYWNWNQVPQCIKVNEAYAWKCPVQSPEFELAGEILIYQATPLDAIHVQGNVTGLKSSAIQVIDVEDTNKTCHITDELGTSDIMKDGLVIDGNILRINEIISNPMMINETFQFYIRAIGSQHVQQQRNDQFDGVAVFVLEQNQKTVGVFSANSPTSI